MASYKSHIDRNNSIFVREKEAAQLLGVGRSTLKRWRQQRRVPYINLKDSVADHGVILYDTTALFKWAQQYNVAPEE